jgi:metal-dependent HD superfamily phosphatase/phosphodiesterase
VADAVARGVVAARVGDATVGVTAGLVAVDGVPPQAMDTTNRAPANNQKSLILLLDLLLHRISRSVHLTNYRTDLDPLRDAKPYK